MALTADEVFAQWQPPITSPQGTEDTYVVTTLVLWSRLPGRIAKTCRIVRAHVAAPQN